MSSVDVIVPCYRYGHFLRECVESVLSQSMVDVRVLIIDDASPDHTAEIGSQLAREDSRVTFSRHNANKGHIATYNEGIEWTSSDYLLLLSADDYLLPRALSRATRLMDSHPDVGFSFGSVIELTNGHTEKLIEPVPELLSGAKECILPGWEFIRVTGARNRVPTPTAVVKTSLQKKVGGYNSQLPHAGDMEMWLRLAAYAGVGVIGEPQAVYRKHSANMSSDYIADFWLSDLKQRRSAIESFLWRCRDVLPDSTQLRNSSHRSLGYEAIGWANAAFNDSNMLLCDRLSQLATDIYPDVKRSTPWVRLYLKRQIGPRAWCAMQPVISRFRQGIFR